MATKFLSIVTLVGLTVALSACSLVQAILPDQEFAVADPIGLDGAVVTAAFIGSTSLSAEAIGGQQVDLAFQGPLPAIDVPEIDDSEFSGLMPVALRTGARFEAGVELFSASSTDGSVFGDTLTFTVSSLQTFSVNDGSGDAPVSFGPFPTPTDVSLVVTKGACVTDSAGTTCDYSVSVGLTDFWMPIEFTDSDLGELWAVLTNGVTPNNLSGTLDLTVQGTVPTDVAVTIILDSAPGTIVF